MNSRFDLALEALDLREQANRLYLSQFAEYQRLPTPSYENHPEEMEKGIRVEPGMQKRSRSYPCKDCDFRSFSARDYLYHRRNEHQDPHAIHECKLCGYAATQLNKVERHSQAVHKKQIPESNLIRRKKKPRQKKSDPQLTRGEIEDRIIVLDNDEEQILEDLTTCTESNSTIPEQHKGTINRLPPDRPDFQVAFREAGTSASESDNSKQSIMTSPVQSPRVVFKCMKCDFQSLSRFILNQHDKSAHQMKKLFRCLKCAFVTNDRGRYTKHIKDHSLSKYTCEYCPFVSSYSKTLLHHLKNVHNVGNHNQGFEINGSRNGQFFEFNSPEPLQPESSQPESSQPETAFTEHSPNSIIFKDENDLYRTLQNGRPVEENQNSNPDISWGDENVFLNKIYSAEVTKTNPAALKHQDFPCPLCGTVFENLAWLARHLTQKHKQSQNVKLLVKAVQEIEPRHESGLEPEVISVATATAPKENLIIKTYSKLPVKHFSDLQPSGSSEVNPKLTLREHEIMVPDSIPEQLSLKYSGSQPSFSAVTTDAPKENLGIKSYSKPAVKYFIDVQPSVNSNEVNYTLASRKNEIIPIKSLPKQLALNKSVCQPSSFSSNCVSPAGGKPFVADVKPSTSPSELPYKRTSMKKDNVVSNSYPLDSATTDDESFVSPPIICSKPKALNVNENLHTKTWKEKISIKFADRKPSISDAGSPLFEMENMCNKSKKNKNQSDSCVTTYVCRVCDHRAPLISQMEKHVTYHRRGKIFSCPVCNYKCRWKADIKKHITKEHDNEDWEYFQSLPNPLSKDISIDNRTPEQNKDLDKSLSAPSPLPFKKPKTKAELMSLLSAEQKLITTHSLPPVSNESENTKRPQTAKKSCPTGSVMDSPSKPKRTLTDFWETEAPKLSIVGEIPRSGESEVTAEVALPNSSEKPSQHVNQKLKYKKENHLKNKRTFDEDSDGDSEINPEHKRMKKEKQSPSLVPDKKYKCIYCPFTSLKASRFHVHIVQHLNTKPYMCSVCSIRSNWDWDINKHIKLKSPRDPAHKSAEILIADKTGLKNYEKYNMYLVDEEPKISKLKSKSPSKESLSLHTSLPVVKDTFNTKGQSIDHSDILVSGALFRCGHCFFKHPDMKSVISHLGVHSETKPFECKICGLVSCWKHVILRHIKSAHGGKSDQLLERLEYELRGHTVFIAGKTEATKEVVPSNVLQCHLCPYTADFKHHIQMHLVHHIEPEGTSVKCPHCPYWVKFKKSLVSHLRLHPSTEDNIPDVHLSPTPTIKIENNDATVNEEFLDGDDDSDGNGNFCKYLCEYCPFSTKSKQSLLSHKQFHCDNQNAPFKCSHCSYWSESQSVLNKHFKIHNQYEDCKGISPEYTKIKPMVDNGLHSQNEYQKSETTPAKLGSNSKNHRMKNKIVKLTNNLISSKIVKPEKNIVNCSSPIRKSVNSSVRKTNCCEYCPFKNVHRINFLTHKQSHRPNPNAKYRCNHCSFWSTTKGGITKHLKLHKKCKHSHLTDKAPPNVETNRLSTNIIVNEKKVDRYKCSFCPMTSITPQNVNSHEALHRQVNPRKYNYFCQICGYQCSAKRSLLIHKKLHGTKTGKKKTYFERETTQLTAFNENLKTDIQPEADLQFPLKSNKKMKTINKKLNLSYCEHCPAVFRINKDYLKHFKLHGSKFPYTCPLCNYKCRQQCFIQKHMIVHSPGYRKKRVSEIYVLKSSNLKDDSASDYISDEAAKPCQMPFKPDKEKKATNKRTGKRYTYLCVHCPAMFHNKNVYSVHKRLHGSLLPYRYACPICNYKARNQRHLQQHMVVHSPGYEKQCLFENNKKSIPDSSAEQEDQPRLSSDTNEKKETIKENSKTGKGKFPYPCKHCPALFNVHKQYLVHNSLHGAPLPISCSQCSYKVQHRGQLKQHLIVHSPSYREKRISKYNNKPKSSSTQVKSSPCNKTAKVSPEITVTSLNAHKKCYYKYACTNCPSVFQMYNRFLSHMSYHGSSLPVACPDCTFRTHSEFKLQCHFKVHARGYLDKYMQASRHYVTKHSQNNFSTDISPVKLSTRKTSKVEVSEVTATDIFTIEKAQTDMYCKNQGRGINLRRKARCNKCPMAFFSENELAFHRTLHQNNGSHKCPKCSYSVDDLDLLNRHKMLHKNLNSSVSSTAGDVSLSNVNFTEGDEDVHNIKEESSNGTLPQALENDKIISKIRLKNFKCTLCPATVQTLGSLKSHLVYHSEKRKYSCDKCNYSVNTSSLLSRHSKLHNSNYGWSKKLGSETQGADSTSSAPQSLDNSKIISTINLKVVKCALCPQVFHTQFRLKKHSIHHGAQCKYTCGKCNYSVNYSSVLSKHVKFHNTNYGLPKKLSNKCLERINSKAEFKLFKCKKCPAMFLKKERMSKHLQFHGVKRHYSCDDCDYSVDSVVFYTKHIKVHRSDYSVAVPKTDKLVPKDSKSSSKKIENIPKSSQTKKAGTPPKSKMAVTLPKTKKAEAPSTTENIEDLQDSSHSKSKSPEKETTTVKPNVKSKIFKNPKVKSRYYCSRCPYTSFRKENASSHFERHRCIERVQCCPYCDYTTPSGAQQKDHIKLHFQKRCHFKISGYMKLKGLEIWIKNEAPTLIFKDNGVNSNNRFFPELVLDAQETNSYILDNTNCESIPVEEQKTVEDQMPIEEQMSVEEQTSVEKQMTSEEQTIEEHMPIEEQTIAEQKTVGEMKRRNLLTSMYVPLDVKLSLDELIDRSEIILGEQSDFHMISHNDKMDAVLLVINSSGSVDQNINTELPTETRNQSIPDYNEMPSGLSSLDVDKTNSRSLGN